MKAKKWVGLAVAVLTLSAALPVVSQADSLDTLDSKEAAAKQTGETLNTEIQSSLTAVNDKYQAVETLQAQIKKNEASLTSTKNNIVKTAETITKRKAVISNQMKDTQLNAGKTKGLTAILSAKNIGELVNRVYAMSVMQKAERGKVVDLNAQKEKLLTLQTKAEDTQNSLAANKTALDSEVANLNSELTNLNTQLESNQTTLAKISSDKQTEKARLVAVAQAAQKAAAQAKEQAEKEAAEKAAQEKAIQEVAAKKAADQKAAADAAAQAAQTQAQQAAAQAQQAAAAQAAADAAAQQQASSSQQSSSQSSSSSSQSSSQSSTTTTTTTESSSAATSTTSGGDAAAKEWIAQKESSGSYTASNGQYYGRYQLGLALLGGDTSPSNQEAVADSYVASRYGSWSNAKAFWLANGWY